MEVDEAANHIRELVDPNANIIWGRRSTRAKVLDGKIRVSVVATGIEARPSPSSRNSSIARATNRS
jgi:cell division GTPase FtsZ